MTLWKCNSCGFIFDRTVKRCKNCKQPKGSPKVNVTVVKTSENNPFFSSKAYSLTWRNKRRYDYLVKVQTHNDGTAWG